MEDDYHATNVSKPSPEQGYGSKALKTKPRVSTSSAIVKETLVKAIKECSKETRKEIIEKLEEKLEKTEVD